ncbi:MAG: isopeptide-forming domain-containing fimbrial protein [Ruminococcaceae bacterium]|nr:isopeptide-forming domain-containing fimbrial protein [Oscillospiraceae bacterium]
MKNIKKIAGILLVAIMIMAMTVNVFALTDQQLIDQYGDVFGEDSIQDGLDHIEDIAPGKRGLLYINGTIQGQKYRLYTIASLESWNGTTYSYKVNPKWAAFFADGAEGAAYANVDAQGYFTWKTGTDEATMKEFTQKALAYAKANYTSSNMDEAEITADGTGYARWYAKYGYHLIDSDTGTLTSLTTNDPHQVITLKNKAPTVTKTVKNGDAQGASNTASIGDTVEYTVTITAQAGAQNYILHDTMSAGLTFDADSVKVYNGSVADGNLITEGTATYSVAGGTKMGSDTEDCTFHVVFAQAFCDTLTADQKIIVTYSATLNGEAVIGGVGENNEAKITYGETSQIETAETKTNTFTFELPVFKYTGDPKTALAGATFSIKDEDGNLIKAIQTEGAADGAVEDVYLVSDDAAAVTQFTTDATGKFTVQGLAAGTYTLTEVTAPQGYNKCVDVEIEIAEDGTIDIANAEGYVEIENKSGSILPSTGGMGTTIFYAVGGLLVVVAIVFLITKKRMYYKG